MPLGYTSAWNTSSPLFLMNPESFSTAQLSCHLLCEACSEFQQQFSSIVIFLMWDHFEVFIEFVMSITSCYYVLVFSGHKACEVYLPARLKPIPLNWKEKS